MLGFRINVLICTVIAVSFESANDARC
jgi:hypothetical protein